LGSRVVARVDPRAKFAAVRAMTALRHSLPELLSFH
jgi:hypothetical protein